ncbi:cytochrome P450 [Sphaerisporangium sp. NPDC049002]|uniref:cytochrome P450 n=1 Tax=unclassified Sphaerisporangium TaxID=2630420 RepID=UPI0033E2FCEA
MHIDDNSPLAIFDWYRETRSENPVFRDDVFNAWHVLRYEDVRMVLSDGETFQSTRPATRRPAVDVFDPGEDTMVRADGTHHRMLRGLVNQAFTPRVVERLAPRVREICGELLDGFEGKGGMEVVADIAYPLPITIIMEMLGVPTDRVEQFRRWSNAVVSGGSGTAREGADTDIGAMMDYFSGVLADRRNAPGDDLISRLLAAEISGQRLTERQLLNFCALMLIAGHETTTSLITNTVFCLQSMPDVLDLVRRSGGDPLPRVIDEVLRYAAPVQAVLRFATADVVVGGRRINAGDTVFPFVGSANRDETAFPDPDRFDPFRAAGPGLAFGHGIHYCLGAPLARLETAVVVSEMLRRFGGKWWAEGIDFDTSIPRFLFGIKRLPLSWDG